MAILPYSYKPLFSNSGSSSWQSGHPLHFGLTALLFLTTCYLYMTSVPAVTFTPTTQLDLPLSKRLERSEAAYQRSINARPYLYKMYGNDPLSYPSEPPYPPYTVWDFLYPAFTCPFETERIGVPGDGGKWSCGVSRLALQEKLVVYSFGINGESSWEEEMLKRTKCEIWGYDFSVTSFGPQISSSHLPRTHFFPVGLSGKDDPKGDPPMYTLETLMKQNGHTFIDVLKVDIENSEYGMMDDLIKFYDGRPLPFGQLLIELHAWTWTHPKANTLVRWFEKLEKAGLRPFMSELNAVAARYHSVPQLSEFSFINIRGQHALISEA